MHTISIIVPVYNAEKYLYRCVKSIQEQTFVNYELILVNDGSTDRSGQMCDTFAVEDKRIIVIHKDNGGVSSARNCGIQVAKGEYLLFIDSDDYIGNDYVKNLVLNKSDLTICGFTVKNENDKELYSLKFRNICYKSKYEIDYKMMYQKYMLYSPYGKLFRKDIINKNHISFPTEMTWGEDGMFISDYIRHVNSINIIDQISYFYIKYNEDRLSTKIRDNIVEMVTISREYCIENVLNYSRESYNGVKEICEKDIKSNCAYFLGILLTSDIMNIKEKKRVLDSFLKNKYIQDIILNREKYYPRGGIEFRCLKYKNSSRIILQNILELTVRKIIINIKQYIGLKG